MQEKSGVEKLKDKLYSRKTRDMGDVRSTLSPSQESAPVAWGAPPPPERPAFEPREPGEGKRRISFATKFFIGALVFFVLAAGAAAYFFFGGTNFISPRNIDIQVVAPSLVDGGAEATLEFIITNRNSSYLELADLIIEYPAGTRDPKNPTASLPRERQSLGAIAPGQQVKRSARAIFYGEEGSEQTVRVLLEYQIKNSNAIFTKEATSAFTLGSSPVSLSVSAPEEAIAGEPFEFEVVVRSNATVPLEHVVVEAQYPFGFSVLGTEPRAEARGAFWRLGTFLPGATKTVVVRGTIEGVDGDERVFRFLAGSDSDQTNTKVQTPFLSVPTTLTVHRPFISGSLSLGGQVGKQVAVAAGKSVPGEVLWQNNLDSEVTNVEIVLQLSGPVLDKTSIQPGLGFYQSTDNSITWSSAQDPTLATVGPGTTGKLTFSFATLSPGLGGTLYSNPTIDLNLIVRGTRTGQGGVPEAVSSAATMRATVASQLSLVATALHTSGPRPPKVEHKSTYGVQWVVRNSSNTVANAAVTAVLPPYAEFVSGGTGITYDSRTRAVRWSLGDVAAGAGYSGAARTASFEVVITPSLSQAGQRPALTGAAQLTGQDRFAGVTITATAEAPAVNDPVQQ